MLSSRLLIRPLVLAFLLASPGARASVSADLLPPSPPVQWLWSGSVSHDGARIKVKLAADLSPSLEVTGGGAPVREVQPTGRVESGEGVWTLDYSLDSLSPGTEYSYVVAGVEGRFRTFPSGPASFTIALGSCAQTGSSHPVFATIAQHDPLFFLHLGDLHYEDIAENDIEVFRRAYDQALGSVTQSALYRSTSTVYIWDDHDFGPNNSDASSPSRDASRAAYRENVPHHELVSDGPIHHAFSAGRVRFVISDMRSERSPPEVPESPERSMMGSEQKEWLKKELLAARDTHALIVWVNSVPWIGDDHGREFIDRWTGFVGERAELSAFIEKNAINNLCVLSGDAHMLAIDDGSNNRYGPARKALFPIFQAAAFDRPGSVKGGPYSHGAHPGPGQFGLMKVVDDGGPDVHVEWFGLDQDNREILRHAFTVRAP